MSYPHTLKLTLSNLLICTHPSGATPGATQSPPNSYHHIISSYHIIIAHAVLVATGALEAKRSEDNVSPRCSCMRHTWEWNRYNLAGGLLVDDLMQPAAGQHISQASLKLQVQSPNYSTQFSLLRQSQTAFQTCSIHFQEPSLGLYTWPLKTGVTKGSLTNIHQLFAGVLSDYLRFRPIYTRLEGGHIHKPQSQFSPSWSGSERAANRHLYKPYSYSKIQYIYIMIWHIWYHVCFSCRRFDLNSFRPMLALVDPQLTTSSENS